MGIHISLHNAKGDDAPDWDFIRHVGDRDVADVFDRLPQVQGPTGHAWLEDAFRPADFAVWRQALAFTDDERFPNPGRFKLMLDLLESDPQWWISISR